MRIRGKLLLGFSAMMLIMLILTSVAYNRMSAIDHQLKTIYNDPYQNYKYIQSLRGQVNTVSRLLANAMIQRESTSANEMKLKSAQSQVLELLEKLSAVRTVDVQESQMSERSAELAKRFMTYVDTVIPMIQGGRYTEAVSLRSSEGLKSQEEFLTFTEQFLSFEEKKIETVFYLSATTFNKSIMWLSILTLAGLLIGVLIIVWTTLSVSRGISTVNTLIKGFTSGQFKALQRIKITSKDELGQVAHFIKDSAAALEERNRNNQLLIQEKEDLSWLKTQVARLTELYSGLTSLEKLAHKFTGEYTPILGAAFSAFYIRDRQNLAYLKLAGTYGYDVSDVKPVRVGEGLVGQSAKDNRRILLNNVKAEYVKIKSGIGETEEVFLLLQPISFEGSVLAVIELAKFHEFTERELDLVGQLAETMGTLMSRLIDRMRVDELLKESQSLTEEAQAQSEELLAQQEELRRSNEELEQKTQALMLSEERLQRQQEELEHSNEELVMKTQLLEQQIRKTDQKHQEVELQKESLEKQAMELAMSTKYKTEFLANMSHELRTPLNSLLILSQLLADNKNGNLDSKQLEYAQTIHSSGSDLLKLIDEILDLSKVETGRMEVYPEEVELEQVATYIERVFSPVAADKRLELIVRLDPKLPKSVYTDEQRLKQILKNLVSNAIKFTKKGYVEVNVLASGNKKIEFKVKDTGIGIAKEKQEMIFEAFRQADGTTSRNYGGTGLGLSISRELAKLLQGQISVTSVENKGSEFTLTLPLYYSMELSSEAAAAAEEQPVVTLPAYHEVIATIAATRKEIQEPAATAMQIQDDRDDLDEEDRVILIIEDDVNFAKVLLDMARQRGFKVLVALQGDHGLTMAKMYTPEAILLDIQLPVMNGWSILHHLKNASGTRHIPVHVITVNEEILQGLSMGALAFLKKPSGREQLEEVFSGIEGFLEKKLKRLLIVEADEEQCRNLEELIGHDDIEITCADTGRIAMELLSGQQFDCMVLDLFLPDMSGFDILDMLRDTHQLQSLPVIIHTNEDLDKKSELKLKKYAESIIIKDVKSPERLLDETALFLHRVEADLPADKREMLRKYQNKEAIFEGKQILLVDDDIRNVFAISSILEANGMEVAFAENGKEALEHLNGTVPYDLVLMDVMMPEMDGYEAMRLIRQHPKFEKLPIIALTAKAMKEDRQKCIEAGASDYVIKPIQNEQLLSLMRVWLYK
ncbi:response regulator [Paenibacillus gansuensis]|uniref:histidine kinase n=1 Tax=Paenibacillus gansuensis TaxID=306542 RepID=A0ABW5P9M7_9BACL